MRFRKLTSGTDVQEIAPRDVTFVRDGFDRLCLHLSGGTTYVDVTAVRTFPLTHPLAYVALVDSEGQEIGFVDDLNRLESPSREVLEKELSLEYFTTRIERILAVQSNHGTSTWKLETDRGPREIHVKDRGDIRAVSPHHYVLTDVNGIKYEVPNTRDLDEKSRVLLEGES